MTVAIVVLIAFGAFCFGMAVGDVMASSRANQPLYRRRITLAPDDSGGSVAARSSEVSWN